MFCRDVPKNTYIRKLISGTLEAQVTHVKILIRCIFVLCIIWGGIFVVENPDRIPSEMQLSGYVFHDSVDPINNPPVEMADNPSWNIDKSLQSTKIQNVNESPAQS